MVGESLREQVIAKIDEAAALYHRLVLLVGPSGAGKTAVLRDVAARKEARLLNVSLEVSRRLLDLTEEQRVLQLPRVLEELIGRGDPLVLLDNTELLFDVRLKQDPLRLLQGLARNRTVVASWNGTVADGHVTYAAPDHPEHRRYPARQLVVVCLPIAG